MSLVCETIVSEDELSQMHTNCETNCGDDEELDYEEELQNQIIDQNTAEDDDKDEGELEEDDDLEEGEVKEEEDDDSDEGKNTAINNRKRVMAPDNSDNNNRVNNNNNNNNNTNSICRFFGRGQCTWGNACRFVHPTGGMLKRLPPLPPMPPMPPMPPHLPPQNRNRREFYENAPPLHGPHAPQNQSSAGSETAWERGLKQAKEMIVRASRRKEEEIDFEDKRFNLGVEEDISRQSRNSSSNSPDDRYDTNNDEYERRRRLAFESAPWNNEEPVGAKIRSAETYRDPWRRSKSPKFRRPIPGSRSDSKRSHSMSSISASGSDSSEFSGSEGSSFSESSGSNVSARSGGRRRFNRKTTEKKKDLIPTNEQRFNKKGISSTNWTKSEPNEYDSWSESLSESESISSYYSGSNSDSDESEPQGKQNRIPKRPNSKKDAKLAINSRKSIDHSDGPPNKKNKISGKSGSATNAPPLSPLLQTNKSVKTVESVPEKSEPPKKSPIKMTFMKKHSTLKKDNTVAVKLNGGRDNEEPEEIIVEEEEDSFQMSPSPELSPRLASKSSSASSPPSQDVSTPPQPQQQTSSSSSSGGSSKHDKQSLLATVSRREELLQQLRAVEDAIARKRSKIN